jgi:thiaminase
MEHAITAQANTEQLEKLEATIANMWEEILSHPFVSQITSSDSAVDVRLYAIYLTQVYHYTWHTARNQALVAVNPANKNIHYMQYCLEHALEETGHELMALHDLRSLGLSVTNPQQEFPLLDTTELLIAYLYWVSSQGNPVQRLGYSFWAEKSYAYIGPVMEALMSHLNLDKTQMTFFYNHAHIDEKHAREVEETLLKICATPEDWRAVTKTAVASLKLTYHILQQVLEEYLLLDEQVDSAFTFLNGLNAFKLDEN